MGDQMEIDPDLYESSPQQTSYPLFAHREPPASLSSTKSFSYDGFTPVAHTATMRKGSKPSWIWAYGGELRDTQDQPTVAQYALDLLCCPVISAECERVFSGAKLLISPNRNRLADDIIETAECLRIWWMRGIIEE